ncbi:MAG: type II toxin-antitoxin system mRNA interferase toxin, RelE/StbE family [Patescibacteria group bacterium]|nr:type II toxin-antitoxin system mRNA interferase toxin, RelE/StbE family [Patescibacteria group bacterium]MDE1944265.1 type II toxin-antitoxin system mRNA interferase toxin, RelE/StbE family [Patescibacteria group bacterium]MDE1945175.1 type II toxin-antitoxin system mRNA interferase toxin, RelE/StbE family [Patescibacteria group bacterium]MDE2058076.1 type II toxin-antitoxin system mRNA interferase toxin, RelE/StbE family [Patescibacteria group bacterium]
MRRKFLTPGFLRALASFVDKHPEFATKAEEVANRIVTGEHAGLRIHALRGPLKGLYAARISQAYRIVFALESDRVIFLDIGAHDDVY